MTTPDRYAELRKQYPDLPDWYWDVAAERRAAEQALAQLRGQLAHLVGYHDRDGAVPIEKIRALVPGLGEEDQ